MGGGAAGSFSGLAGTCDSGPRELFSQPLPRQSWALNVRRAGIQQRKKCQGPSLLRPRARHSLGLRLSAPAFREHRCEMAAVAHEKSEAVFFTNDSPGRDFPDRIVADMVAGRHCAVLHCMCCARCAADCAFPPRRSAALCGRQGCKLPSGLKPVYMGSAVHCAGTPNVWMARCCACSCYLPGLVRSCRDQQMPACLPARPPACRAAGRADLPVQGRSV